MEIKTVHFLFVSKHMQMHMQMPLPLVGKYIVCKDHCVGVFLQNLVFGNLQKVDHNHATGNRPLPFLHCPICIVPHTHNCCHHSVPTQAQETESQLYSENIWPATIMEHQVLPLPF